MHSKYVSAHRTHMQTDTVYPHWRAVVIGTMSGADVNSERQMQGFNSGTTAWFAWSAAYLSVIKLCTNSQYAGRKSLPTGEHSHVCVYEEESESSLCGMVWSGCTSLIIEQDKTRDQSSNRHEIHSSGYSNFHVLWEILNVQCSFMPNLNH